MVNGEERRRKKWRCLGRPGRITIHRIIFYLRLNRHVVEIYISSIIVRRFINMQMRRDIGFGWRRDGAANAGAFKRGNKSEKSLETLPT